MQSPPTAPNGNKSNFFYQTMTFITKLWNIKPWYRQSTRVYVYANASDFQTQMLFTNNDDDSSFQRGVVWNGLFIFLFRCSCKLHAFHLI
mmetsp:Transcript_20802/g.48975  ORF Transcript_20802/g.48975 Transcript_20802/m.48975 type:complete len:90 (-) Transcript_20802:1017-1286(-)